MSMNQPTAADVGRAVNEVLRRHWVLYLVEGIVLVVLGAIAVIISPLATLAITILFGWLFLLSGVLGLITSFWMRAAPGFWWSLISAVLGIVIGVWLLAQPVAGALSLTFLLVVFFLIEGAVSIMFALEHKRELSGRWGWMLTSGIVDLVLGAMILGGYPSTAAWAIGVLVGINMVFGGVALLMMALHARGAL